MSTPQLAWFTISDAAKALGISERTVQRRIESGEWESRKDGQGRRLVAVPQDAMPPESQAVSLIHEQSRAMVETSQALAVALKRAEANLEDLRAMVATEGARGRRAWTVATMSGMVAVLAIVALLVVVMRSPTSSHKTDTVSEEWWGGAPWAWPRTKQQQEELDAMRKRPKTIDELAKEMKEEAAEMERRRTINEMFPTANPVTVISP
jgi:excisionase family DNA binding protein